MDVNATLREMREISERINALLITDADPVDADRLAELFAALDGWLSKGGFLPRDWAPLDHASLHDWAPR